MTRDDLYWTPGIGWQSSAGFAGIWNQLTIGWMAAPRQRYCVIRGNRASITRDGREVLDGAEGWAA